MIQQLKKVAADLRAAQDAAFAPFLAERAKAVEDALSENLPRAIAAVDRLNDWLYDQGIAAGLSDDELAAASVVYNTYTLAVDVDGKVVWEDQSDSEDELTFECLRGRYVALLKLRDCYRDNR